MAMEIVIQEQMGLFGKKSTTYPKTSSYNSASNKHLSIDGENQEPRTIEVSIQFIRIGEVDTFSEKFQAEVIIRSTWFEHEKCIEDLSDDEDTSSSDASSRASREKRRRRAKKSRKSTKNSLADDLLKIQPPPEKTNTTANDEEAAEATPNANETIASTTSAEEETLRQVKKIKKPKKWTYDKDKHWYPRLFIENALNDLKEEITYDMEKVDDKYMITETRTSKGSFWERMELNNFPLDIQELTITLASKRKQSEVKLVTDTSRVSAINTETINTFRDQQKWRLYRHVDRGVQASYDYMSAKDLNRGKLKDSATGDEKKIKRPKYVVMAYCSRRPGYYIINAFAINILITCLSLTLFITETSQAPSRIRGTFTLILTSVSFKLVTGRQLPTISYMTSLDRYQIFNIFYLVCCCFWHAFISLLDIDMGLKTNIDNIGWLVFGLLFIGLQVLFGFILMTGYRVVLKKKEEEQNFLKRNMYCEEFDPYS